jgi:hypothetical protein
VRRKFKSLCRIGLLLAVGGTLALARTDSPPPDQVEEDWQVVVAVPDPLAVGPQVTTIMSPTTDPTAAFVTFYLNYRDDPSWTPGGLQVKGYGAAPGPAISAPLLVSNTQGTEVCQTSGETITWTQRLSVSGGNLNFNVVNGQSTTWGQFGQGQGNLELSVSSSVADLGGYKPDYSVTKSGVSWQSNRASSMTLLQVRYYSGGKLISTDATPRSIALTSGN